MKFHSMEFQLIKSNHHQQRKMSACVLTCYIILTSRLVDIFYDLFMSIKAYAVNTCADV
jgi:hypothetical protein